MIPGLGQVKLIGAALAAAGGISLFFYVGMLKSDVKAAEQGEINALTALSRAAGKVEELGAANNELITQLDTAQELVNISDTAAAEARETITRIRSDISESRRELSNAPETDNAPAAPVLEYTANRLRLLSQSNWGMRASSQD